MRFREPSVQAHVDDGCQAGPGSIDRKSWTDKSLELNFRFHGTVIALLIIVDKDKPIWAIQSCGNSGVDLAKVELDDVVRGAQKSEGARNRISLRLQKKDGTEYELFLLIAEKFLDKAIFLIIANIGITLRDLELLDISNSKGKSSRRSPVAGSRPSP